MTPFALTQRLHTDSLEEVYGTIYPEILVHDDRVREALLIDRRGITRTYAVSFFENDNKNPEIITINESIKNGGLIGKVFREFGYDIRKSVTDCFILQTPAWLMHEFRTREPESKTRISEFYARKGSEDPVLYALVIEVYTPDFRPATINNVDMEQIRPASELLEQAGFSLSEIWDSLEPSSSRASDDRYRTALEQSVAHRSQTRERFLAYISTRQEIPKFPQTRLE